MDRFPRNYKKKLYGSDSYRKYKRVNAKPGLSGFFTFDESNNSYNGRYHDSKSYQSRGSYGNRGAHDAYRDRSNYYADDVYFNKHRQFVESKDECKDNACKENSYRDNDFKGHGYRESAFKGNCFRDSKDNNYRDTNYRESNFRDNISTHINFKDNLKESSYGYYSPHNNHSFKKRYGDDQNVDYKSNKGYKFDPKRYSDEQYVGKSRNYVAGWEYSNKRHSDDFYIDRRNRENSRRFIGERNIAISDSFHSSAEDYTGIFDCDTVENFRLSGYQQRSDTPVEDMDCRKFSEDLLHKKQQEQLVCIIENRKNIEERKIISSEGFEKEYKQGKTTVNENDENTVYENTVNENYETTVNENYENTVNENYENYENYENTVNETKNEYSVSSNVSNNLKSKVYIRDSENSINNPSSENNKCIVNMEIINDNHKKQKDKNLCDLDEMEIDILKTIIDFYANARKMETPFNKYNKLEKYENETVKKLEEIVIRLDKDIDKNITQSGDDSVIKEDLVQRESVSPTKKTIGTRKRRLRPNKTETAHDVRYLHFIKKTCGINKGNAYEYMKYQNRLLNERCKINKADILPSVKTTEAVREGNSMVIRTVTNEDTIEETKLEKVAEICSVKSPSFDWKEFEYCVYKNEDDIVELSKAIGLGMEEAILAYYLNCHRVSVDNKTLINTIIGRDWTEADKKYFESNYKKHGSKFWKYKMDKSTNEIEIYHKWYVEHMINLRWTEEEKKIFKENIDTFKGKWKEITDKLPGKTTKDIKEFYRDYYLKSIENEKISTRKR